MARTAQAGWEERIERWRKSGQSVEDFCAREGIKTAALKWWRWKLGGELEGVPRKVEGPAFVEIEVSRARRLARGSAEPASGPYEVLLANGRVVRVPRGGVDEELVRVLALAERAR